MNTYELQGDFGFENLVRVDRPSPQPGPGEVLVDIKAVSINYRDLMMIRGEYNPNQPLPLVPFSDACGEVIEVGEAVEQFETGDRVAPIFAQKWRSGNLTPRLRSSTLGGPRDGTLTQQRTFPEEGLVSIPEHLTDEEAAGLPCAGVTAWNALTWGYSLKPGETVLLLGTGGVSLFGLQFAQAFGARTIITSSKDEKLRRAREMGADETINYESNPDWDEQVKGLCEGTGVDRVVEVGGAGTLQKSLNSAAFSAHISIIGVLSGVRSKVNVTSALMKGLNLKGILVGSRMDFEAMNKAIVKNDLHPHVDKVFGFDDVIEACRYQEAGKHMGKVVIRTE
ncbi:MAG: NAD(P)-dependent alcohol dehydrogenase [bacterium]